uniref:Uncharacterized protein n=1 Tax=Ixodes ricinus TaxID=34613 RepID=A0A6B0V2K5_IXORI
MNGGGGRLLVRHQGMSFVCFFGLLTFGSGSFLRFVFAAAASVPGQAFFVKPYDDLRAADVGDAGGHDVRLVAVLPLDQEHELARRVGGADDAIGVQAAVETTWLGVSILPLLLAAGRLGVVFHLLGVRVLLAFFLELGDEARAVQVLFGFPGVVAFGVTFPLEVVLDLALTHPAVDDLFDDEFFGFGGGAVLVGAFVLGCVA